MNRNDLLSKIKKLLSLGQSPNVNEAENARAMADKLIAKHNVTEEELASIADKGELYGDNEKIFSTIGIVGWKQQLALAIATYLDCQIIQEEAVPSEGPHQFSYFAYGDDDQVHKIQFVFHAFLRKIIILSDTKCLGKDANYIDSYCEGVVESIKSNIHLYGIDIPEIKKPLKQVEEATSNNKTALTKPGTKEEPTKERVDVNSQSFVHDVVAYFLGVGDGRKLNLEDILELEIKEVNQIASEEIPALQ